MIQRKNDYFDNSRYAPVIPAKAGMTAGEDSRLILRPAA